MIELILQMLEITESKHENINQLKGKYEIKLNLKEAREQIKMFKT